VAAAPSAGRYWAFISYSHRDRQWGNWLHRAIETYKVPKALVGGDVPARLFPVFRDREELAGAADLTVERRPAAGVRRRELRADLGSRHRRGLRRPRDDTGYAWSVAFSPDDRVLALGGKHLLLWDVAGRRALPTPADAGTDIRAVAISRDGVLAIGATIRRSGSGSCRPWRGVAACAVTQDGRRVLNLVMPGVSCTVGEQIAALGRVAGPATIARIKRVPDELVIRIVAGWPERVNAQRALSRGFKAALVIDIDGHPSVLDLAR
jgi:hypothetical protein